MLTKMMAEVEGALADFRPERLYGLVCGVTDNGFQVKGLGAMARIGDGLILKRKSGADVVGEIVALEPGADGAIAVAMAFDPIDGAAIGDPAELTPSLDPKPSEAWLGQVIDANGRPTSGEALAPGARKAPLRAAPPPALSRRLVGDRLGTGHAPLDTVLPICRGQRMGVFSGSGVGKSRLLGALAQRMTADVVVIGLIGERGREVRDFVDNILGPDAMRRTVVIAATSDQPAAMKRRAAWLTLCVAEHFRNQGRHVLLLLDSLTRFAEAHRQVALTSGERAGVGGFPPSTHNAVAALAERAGPGPDQEGMGDITAIFTVLVAGSDMDEPVADMTRGILDGHVVLSREIAERGRFPAIDVRRSVSRSLPDAASAAENKVIAKARRLLAVYEQAEPMIQIGLYQAGADIEIDRAIDVWPRLDAFFADASETPDAAFEQLSEIVGVSLQEEEAEPALAPLQRRAPQAGEAPAAAKPASGGAANATAKAASAAPRRILPAKEAAALARKAG
ncbi:MAG: FliI/YscN family ATPase [Pseudomonadota bacterium]